MMASCLPMGNSRSSGELVRKPVVSYAQAGVSAQSKPSALDFLPRLWHRGAGDLPRCTRIPVVKQVT
jgi:hypothetical protein